MSPTSLQIFDTKRIWIINLIKVTNHWGVERVNISGDRNWVEDYFCINSGVRELYKVTMAVSVFIHVVMALWIKYLIRNIL